MTTYEGGPRTPFLAQWKGKFRPGMTYDYPVLNLDALPTLIAAAGGTVDPVWKLDGVDLVPFLTGKNASKPHETIYWRYSPQWAIRHGDYKLVVSRGGKQTPELYNLANDIGEQNDLAAAQPEKVKELRGLWEQWNAEQSEPSAPNTPAKKKGKANKKKKLSQP